MGLGLHGGGTAAAKFFYSLGSKITITDLKTRRELAPSLKALARLKGVTYHLGRHERIDFRSTDYIIRNPGVPDNSSFLEIARRYHIAILSDVEIFFRCSRAPIIAVTGTKGKSTTTALIAKLLSHAGKHVWIGGNIRTSVLSFLPRVRPNHIAVLELSSFQLDLLAESQISPHIAVITNIFPDHLNRYPSFQAYIESKMQIFRFQKPDDMLFLNGRDARLRKIARRSPGKVIFFDPTATTNTFSLKDRQDFPSYILPNIAAAIAVAKFFKVPRAKIQAALKTFHNMPGRMELIGKTHGVQFINDTTATNPTAALSAVIATKHYISGKNLHCIVGGSDKGLSVDAFAHALVENAASIILLPGSATKRIVANMQKQLAHIPMRERGVSPAPKIFFVKSMREAVRVATSSAQPGDAVLLSPGAASFGLFQHEFDRGEQFVEAVHRMRPKRG